jgi:hypothetical protein
MRTFALPHRVFRGLFRAVDPLGVAGLALRASPVLSHVGERPLAIFRGRSASRDGLVGLTRLRHNLRHGVINCHSASIVTLVDHYVFGELNRLAIPGLISSSTTQRGLKKQQP